MLVCSSVTTPIPTSRERNVTFQKTHNANTPTRHLYSICSAVYITNRSLPVPLTASARQRRNSFQNASNRLRSSQKNTLTNFHLMYVHWNASMKSMPPTVMSLSSISCTAKRIAERLLRRRNTGSLLAMLHLLTKSLLNSCLLNIMKRLANTMTGRLFRANRPYTHSLTVRK